MYKLKEYILIAIAALAFMLITGIAKANDYNTAVVGHVISETVKGTDIDHTAILESEMNKIAYAFALEMTSVLEKHLPYILEGIAADIRLKADNEYKCNLYKGTNYECK
tara:strand:- start:295 stop:621 length:327 start_codon:yes stop_codon:yes gene_type:complete